MSVRLAVWVEPPLVPVIVSAKVPRGVFVLVLTVSVDVVVVGLGLNDAVVREGSPVTLRLTEPVNPFNRLIVTEYVVRCPRGTDWLDGVADSEKSGDGCGVSHPSATGYCCWLRCWDASSTWMPWNRWRTLIATRS